MGVDWRGPMYIPPETKDRWRRECSRCGRIEYTERTEEIKRKVPSW